MVWIRQWWRHRRRVIRSLHTKYRLVCKNKCSATKHLYIVSLMIEMSWYFDTLHLTVCWQVYGFANSRDIHISCVHNHEFALFYKNKNGATETLAACKLLITIMEAFAFHPPNLLSDVLYTAWFLYQLRYM